MAGRRSRPDRQPVRAGGRGDLKVAGTIGLRLPLRGSGRVAQAESAARESALVERITAYLKRQPGCYVRKMHGSEFQAGLPDLLGCCHGRFFAIECKRVGEKPTPLQVSELLRIRGAGGAVCWVDTFEGFLAFWGRGR